MGDDSDIQAKGIGRIDLEYGYFNNVLFVPDLEANLLSFYQMTHNGVDKRVEFTQNYVDISEISTGQVVAVGFGDHDSRMYKFSHFLHTPKGVCSCHIQMRQEICVMRDMVISTIGTSKH